MLRRLYWRAAVILVGIFGGAAVPTPTELGFIGVSPAEAKAYYTRKRVHRDWITGRVIKRSAGRKRTAVAKGSAKRGAKAVYSAGAAPPSAGTRVAALPMPAAGPGMAAPFMQAAPLVPLAENERLSKLREALQARASALTTGRIVTQQTPRPAPEPQSVSLDFNSGMKTTLFSDGTAITAPFDVGALKGLAAAPRGLN